MGGQWHSAACKVGAQPLCASAGGTWTPRRMWSLEGGVDLLVVGLLQGCGGYPFFDPCAPIQQLLDYLQAAGYESPSNKR